MTFEGLVRLYKRYNTTILFIYLRYDSDPMSLSFEINCSIPILYDTLYVIDTLFSVAHGILITVSLIVWL